MRKSSELRKKLEISYYQTDEIVIKGIKTGQVLVKVRINEKGYKVYINFRKIIKTNKESTSFSSY